ncbi:Rne/Rng family ribonuclease [Pampinifervens florentissimum]|uniref:Rne/Rng family ribonuclease n=1 Tax=Pampinifervens florentissimum TaxID=1632019 RepID=UPI0013B48F21|nr:Rne/Rng family ribonuclease [Hydrogenobacter sp. T-8]QID33726.1 Rne/Rng family ribonuclease [Hydrogenobacter sp. T-8]
MAKRLIVLSSDELILSFLIDGETTYRISAEPMGGQRLLDSIFKGRVKRLAKGMDGVFVDIGIGRDAFLPLKGESYKVGDSVIVQVLREPEGEKGAKLTTSIKFVGKYLVYFPKGKDIRCSSKVHVEKRESLCKLLEGDIGEEGVIIRSSAVHADPEAIRNELHKLRDQWQWVQRKAKALKKPQIILEEYPSYIRLIRDYWQEIEEVVSDNTVVWNNIASFLEEFEPSLLRKNLYLKDPSSYVHRYKLYEVLKGVFNKVLWLKSGGYIVIEETEAFTIIDVNSGDPLGSCHEENALKTNLEAVKEIVRQIILRDIGGIILVDFIDMKKQENRNLIINSMLSAFGEEACGVNIYGFTKLGILEMSRRKTGRSVTKMLSEPCPICSGKGHIKSSSLFFLELDKDIPLYHQSSVELQVHPLRYESVNKRLRARGFTNVQLSISEDININSYSLSHA